MGPLTTFVGPYPLEIGRERVTDETAAMTPVTPNDALLSTPNRLGAPDFEGWAEALRKLVAPLQKPVAHLQRSVNGSAAPVNHVFWCI